MLAGGPQWKPTEWTPIEQPGGAFFPGLKVTCFAPPHWVFWKIEPPSEHWWVSWQVEPSGMPYSQSTSASWDEEICSSLMENESSSLEEMDG